LSSSYTFRIHSLVDFDSDIQNSLDLASGIRIRRIRKEEKYAEYRRGSLVPTWGQGLGIGREGRLFFVTECLTSASTNPKEELDRVTVCLLLFKPNEDSNNKLASFETEYGGGGTTPNSTLPAISKTELDFGAASYPRYSLKSTDFGEFKYFWTQSTANPWHQTFSSTGRRLLRLQARVGTDSDEDRLIDVMTAFEAMILDGEHAKGATIARRISRLLQYPNATSEQYTKGRLEVAYRLRNDIIHDGQFSSANLNTIGNPAAMGRFLTEIEEYLRNAMVRYIVEMNNCKSKADIISKFN